MFLRFILYFFLIILTSCSSVQTMLSVNNEYPDTLKVDGKCAIIFEPTMKCLQYWQTILDEESYMDYIDDLLYNHETAMDFFTSNGVETISTNKCSVVLKNKHGKIFKFSRKPSDDFDLILVNDFHRPVKTSSFDYLIDVNEIFTK